MQYQEGFENVVAQSSRSELGVIYPASIFAKQWKDDRILDEEDEVDEPIAVDQSAEVARHVENIEVDSIVVATEVDS